MAFSEADFPKIVSVDDHVIEPAHLFREWLPKMYHDRGPQPLRAGLGSMVYTGGKYQITMDENGPACDWWIYEDLKFPLKRHIASVGFDRDDMTLSAITYDEMRPGCYDPKARIDDMEMNWVEASLSFPTFPRFCGQTFLEAADREVALACVKAYNDWMVDEWCGDSDGRLIPLCLIPLWDAQLAAEEVRRNADRGVHAVCFSELPHHLGLPTIHTDAWDPFLSACADTATVVCMHIGSSSQMPAASPDAPPAAQATLSFNNAMASMSDWLFSGKLIQFPELRLAYSEGQIGWIPYILERADVVWEEHRAWGGVRDIIPEPPSTYYYRSIYGCFFRDQHGIDSIEKVGVDNTTFETDYPHTDSTWPHTKKLAIEMCDGLADDVVRKLMRGNAIKMLSLDLAP